MSYDIRGRQVPESEVAEDLGFSDVHELRRWQTEQGQRVAELEHELRTAESDRDNFRWAGRRMMVVLEELARVIDAGEEFTPGNRLAIVPADLRLAIGVVCGKEADWGGKINAWLKEKQAR